MVGYEFDLKTNQLTPRFAQNKTAGLCHAFTAYRAADDAPGNVALKEAESD